MILTKKQCNEIISWYRQYPNGNVRSTPEVCSPRGLHKKRLDYHITLVHRDSTTQWLFDTVEKFLKPDFPDNTASKGEYFYGHEWFEGARFGRHRDKDRSILWGLVVGATLNEGYEGGNLITYEPDGEVATNIGELYYMYSDQWHEVKEVTSGTRFSFVYFVPHELLGKSKPLM